MLPLLLFPLGGIEKVKEMEERQRPPSAVSFEVTHTSERRLCLTVEETSWQRLEWITGPTASRQRHPPPPVALPLLTLHCQGR